MSELVKILSVEDSSTVAAMLRMGMEDQRIDGLNFELTQATNVDQAEAAIRSTKFDVILLDLMLPDSQNEFETFRRVRDACGGVPIIVTTALSDLRLARRMLEMGASDFKIKGYYTTTSVTISVLRAWIQNKKEAPSDITP